MRRFLYDLTAPFPVRFIKPGGRPYIERYYMGRIGPWTFLLHRFVGADVGDEHVHDHPWRWSLAFVLAGGYVEKVMVRLCSILGIVTTTRFVGRFCFNWISATKAHQIVYAMPETWTFLIHGPKFKGWGFFRHLGGGHVEYGNAFADRDDSHEWWLTAPVGELSGREPFPETF